jgi:hypothetical protein
MVNYSTKTKRSNQAAALVITTRGEFARRSIILLRGTAIILHQEGDCFSHGRIEAPKPREYNHISCGKSGAALESEVQYV